MPFVRPADENGPDLATLTLRQRWTPTARGWALIVMAVGSIVRAVSYLKVDAPPDQLAFVDMMIPPFGERVWWLAAAWFGVGLWCLVSLVARRWVAALGAGVGLNLLWATSLIVSTVLLGNDRSWVSSITYFQVAGLCVAISAMRDTNAT